MMIVVYVAVAAVALWCLVKAMSGPAGRLDKVDRERNAFMTAVGSLMGDEDLFPEHNILLGYMADNVANPDLPLEALASFLTGGFRSQLNNPSALPRDLMAAHKTLARIRPDMAARVDKAVDAFVRANTGQVPVIGGLCRLILLRKGRLDMAVPGLVAAYEATLHAPVERISQKLSAA